jgi:replicative DNA helicase
MEHDPSYGRGSPLLGLSQRMPPRNAEAEQCLLGAILANNKALDRVVGFLKPEHFADAIHGRIYQACVRRVLAGSVADAVTLKNEFEHAGVLDEVGGTKYLAQLLSAMVGILNAGEYGQAIHDAWMRRQAIDIGETLVNNAFGADPELGAPALIAQATAELDGIRGMGGRERQVTELNDAMDTAIAEAEAAYRRGGPVGLSVGMPGVDAVLGGLENGTMNLLAGRPGMGKTALAIQWGVHAARALREEAQGKTGPGGGVVVVSLEMSAQALARRVLAASSGVSSTTMKRGGFSGEHAYQIVHARKYLNDLPLSIVDGSGLSVGMMRLEVRKQARKRPIRMLMVDHLHLLQAEERDRRSGATYAVGQVALGLLEICKEFDVPLVALAQLSRAVEGRDDHRPNNSDLRQAGDIEQNADTISFVYRPEYYLPKYPPDRNPGEAEEKWQARRSDWYKQRDVLAGVAELIVTKVRDGEGGVVPLRFHGPTTSFSEATPAFADEEDAQGRFACPNLLAIRRGRSKSKHAPGD